MALYDQTIVDPFDEETDELNITDPFDEPAEEEREMPQDGTFLGIMGETKREVAPGLSEFYRPVLEGAGATAGGIVGAPAGPGGVVAGGVGGYVVGKKAADILDEALGLRQPVSAVEQAKETGQDILTGLEYEALGLGVGAAFVPVVRGGKLTLQKISGGVKNLVTKKGFQESAGKTLVAYTSDGAIYARNAREAANLEQEIPGLKFTRGQRTADPNAIRMERPLIRGNSKVADQNAAMMEQNKKALEKYFEKNFPGNEDASTLLEALGKKQSNLQYTAEEAAGRAQGRINALPREDPSMTGEKILGDLRGREAVRKAEAGAKYEALPETEIPINQLMTDINEIAKPLSKVEDPGNIPPLLKRMQDTYKDTTTTSLQDLQQLRSEIGDALSDIDRSATPNRRMKMRLTQMKNAVDKTLETEAGAEGLAEANRFFKQDYAEIFRQGSVGEILRPGTQTGGARIPLSKIPTRVWNTSNLSAADDFIKAVGKEDAGGLIGDYAAYDLLKSATDEAGVIIPGRLKNWQNRHSDLLEKFGLYDKFNGVFGAQQAADEAAANLAKFEKSAAKRALETDPDQAIKNALSGKNKRIAMNELLEQVRGDKAAKAGLQRAFADHVLDRAQLITYDIPTKPSVSAATLIKVMKEYKPAMNALYKDSPRKLHALNTMQRVYEVSSRNISSPLGGGSDTAENLATQASKSLFSNLLSRPISIARNILNLAGRYSKSNVDNLLRQSIFDADLADTLMEAYLKRNNRELATALIDKAIDQAASNTLQRMTTFGQMSSRNIGQVTAGTAAAIGDGQ